MSSRSISWMQFPQKKIFSIEYFSESEMGKTHNALTYPNVAICDTISEGEVHQVAEKFGNSMVFRAKTFDDIRRFADYCVLNAKIESIAVDSGADLTEMAENEWLGEHKGRTSVYVPDAGAFQWAEVYEKIDDLVQKIKASNKYLIVTSRLKDEYIESEIEVGGKPKKISVKSGERTHDGYKKFKYGYGLSVRVQLVGKRGRFDRT